MALLMFALVIGIFVYDALPPGTAPRGIAWWLILLVMLVPKLLLAAAEWLAVAWGLRQFGQLRGPRAVRAVDHAFSGFLLLTVALYALDLGIGGLTLVRYWLGDLVLADELLFMLPTLALILWTWSTYYPIERRLRQAVVMSRADRGLPVYPIPSRPAYVWGQLRHYAALILLPLLMVYAWQQIVMRLGPGAWAVIPGWLATPLFVAGAIAVFMLVPLLVRLIWDTSPLPAGELRDHLTALCRQYGVRVCQLLLWRTQGLQVNAAVIGLLAPLRFIMLTDALLETVPRPQVEAVMAHEIAHIRGHHMFWMMCSAAGSLGVFELIGSVIFRFHPHWVTGLGYAGDLPWPAALVIVAVAAAWWATFGFISRRFERQADTFAVQHFARECHAADLGAIDQQAADVMIEALGRTAMSRPGGPDRRNWRHGSVRWRQAYLRQLVGQPIERLSIDHQLGWIKLASVLAVIAAVALSIW